MITKKLENFLKHEKAQYNVITHPERFTSQEIAGVEHVTGKEFAKVVMVKAGNKDLMVVIPADRTVDLLKLGAELGTYDLRVEEEKEFASLFPDCETGAMPPFGKLYNVPCYVDQTLLELGEVCFNGGNHRESITLTTEDFRRIVDAKIGDFASPSRMVA